MSFFCFSIGRFSVLINFLDLDRDKLTKTKIKSVIVKVSRWKALADVIHTKGNMEKMEAMEEELKRLMVGLGANIKVTGTKKSSGKLQRTLHVPRSA